MMGTLGSNGKHNKTNSRIKKIIIWIQPYSKATWRYIIVLYITGVKCKMSLAAHTKIKNSVLYHLLSVHAQSIKKCWHHFAEHEHLKVKQDKQILRHIASDATISAQ